MRSARRVVALAVLALPAAAPAQPGVTWTPLSTSNPEHAAILAWHKALVSNDLAAYQRIKAGMAAMSAPTQRTHFDAVRAMTPPTLMFASSHVQTNPNGTKEYTVAGCIRQPGDTRDMRVIAAVTPLQQGGQWRIVGSDFSTPWNNTIRDCPVK